MASSLNYRVKYVQPLHFFGKLINGQTNCKGFYVDTVGEVEINIVNIRCEMDIDNTN